MKQLLRRFADASLRAENSQLRGEVRLLTARGKRAIRAALRHQAEETRLAAELMEARAELFEAQQALAERAPKETTK